MNFLKNTGKGEGDRTPIFRKILHFFQVQELKLKEYIHLLTLEESALGAGQMDKVAFYVEKEKEMITSLENYQKVLAPLEEMVKKEYDASQYREFSGKIKELKQVIAGLSAESGERVRRNTLLIQKEMEMVAGELKQVKINLAGRRQFARPAKPGNPTVIDIKT